MPSLLYMHGGHKTDTKHHVQFAARISALPFHSQAHRHGGAATSSGGGPMSSGKGGRGRGKPAAAAEMANGTPDLSTWTGSRSELQTLQRQVQTYGASASRHAQHIAATTVLIDTASYGCCLAAPSQPPAEAVCLTNCVLNVWRCGRTGQEEQEAVCGNGASEAGGARRQGAADARVSRQRRVFSRATLAFARLPCLTGIFSQAQPSAHSIAGSQCQLWARSAVSCGTCISSMFTHIVQASNASTTLSRCSHAKSAGLKRKHDTRAERAQEEA